MNTLVVFSRFVLKNVDYIILHIPFYQFTDCITDRLSIYIQTIQEPQPCSPLVVGGSSFTLFSMGSDTFSKIN